MYKLIPAQEGQEDLLLFFRLEGEAAERHGAIGCYKFEFDNTGSEFRTTWYDYQPHLKSAAFRADMNSVISYLRRESELSPFNDFSAFCNEHEGRTISGDGVNVPFAFAVKLQTEDYSYYLRINRINSYVHIFAYDNRYLLPELAGQHGLPNYCFCVLPSTGEMIRVVRGESGYYPCNSAGMSPETIRFKVNDENQLRCVTRAQEEAMLAGSLFGWNTAAAKPWNYDQDGRPRPPAPKIREQER